MKITGVIPARFASTRFPGKPLASILGKPMIQWVYERASSVEGLESVIVATDSKDIFSIVEDFGGKAVMTPEDCSSGSDRVWSAVQDMDCDVVVNIQGDEPALSSEAVKSLIELMKEDPSLKMGTLVARIDNRDDYENPSVVKVVMGDGNRCIYFSRSPVPHLRDGRDEFCGLRRHVGIYAFRKEFLKRFTAWPAGKLESMEKLEQLRALERGIVIRAALVEWAGRGVDLPEDIPAVEQILVKEVAR